MRKLLYVSEGIVHPSLRTRLALGRVLSEESPMEEVHETTLRTLAQHDLSRYAAVVFFVHHPKDNASVVRRLGRYVADGGSILAIHGAGASFKHSQTYGDLIGGRLISHKRVGELLVRPAGDPGAVFSHRTPFSIVDELYRHQIRGDVSIHYVADTAEGPEPVAWSRRHERGRVCYISLGHRLRTIAHSVFRAMVVDALLWLAEDKQEHAAS